MLAGASPHGDHDHGHQHEHQAVPSDLSLRVKSLESLLVEKGLVDRAALDVIVDLYETKIGPRNGARVVARAQHASDRPYAPAAIRAGQAGRHRDGPWRLSLSRHERACPGREAAARLLGAVCRPRAVGTAGLAARLRAHRHVG
ncbi:MAG: hypothetical protein EXQ53_06900 [Acidobacteria bacterium]|nr:hypothetical protein [Acidobacteriota bacterium]